MSIIQCMEPIRVTEVVNEKGFIHQIKWDGVRGVTAIENGRITLYTKKGGVCTEAYPEIFSLPDQLSAKQAVLDGELVVFDNGRPSFYNVLKRSLTRSEAVVKSIKAQYPAKYIIFDLLFLNNEDLRQKPLSERQQILQKHFSSSPSAALTDSFEDGNALLELMRQRNMEGIVSKRTDSRYIAGKKHNDWFKTKISKKILCVIIGVQVKNALPASLALGIYREGELAAVGGVSSGLNQSDLRLLKDYIEKEKTGEDKDTVWVRPLLTCWVKFAEWTDHMTLRHPVLLWFSDKDPEEAAGEEFII